MCQEFLNEKKKKLFSFLKEQWIIMYKTQTWLEKIIINEIIMKWNLLSVPEIDIFNNYYYYYYFYYYNNYYYYHYYYVLLLILLLLLHISAKTSLLSLMLMMTCPIKQRCWNRNIPELQCAKNILSITTCPIAFLSSTLMAKCQDKPPTQLSLAKIHFL